QVLESVAVGTRRRTLHLRIVAREDRTWLDQRLRRRAWQQRLQPIERDVRLAKLAEKLAESGRRAGHDAQVGDDQREIADGKVWPAGRPTHRARRDDQESAGADVRGVAGD